jgi:hypothetical protein
MVRKGGDMATSSQNFTLGQPEWTTKAERRGLDPLGMQTTSVALYQQLVPGISNVTLRMRYYGLYSWLAHMYAKTVGDTSVETWCRFLRRAEALYALTATHHGGERGVAGVDWASRTLSFATKGAIVFSPGTDRGEGMPQYLKQKFGAFGAAYGSQVIDIGLLETPQGRAVPVPTAGIGDNVAHAFGTAIGDAGETFLRAAAAGSVQRFELDLLEPMLPSHIASSGLERELYETLLFAGDGRQKDRASARGSSLRLLLRAAKRLGGSMRVNDLRWALYASEFAQDDDLEALTPEEDAQRFAWTAYQANDLLHACYETLLKLVLDILGTAPTGMPPERLVSRAVADLRNAIADHGAASWREFVDSIQVAADPRAENGRLGEVALLRVAFKSAGLEVMSSDASVKSALLLLATLHKRVHPLLERIASSLPVLSHGDFLQSIVTELQFLEVHGSVPLEGMLTRLVKERVIDRHLWVALQKFRGQGDYTFLLESDEGRVRLRQKDGPVLTNPRLASAVTFLQDIHLLGEMGPTAAGLRLVEAA